MPVCCVHSCLFPGKRFSRFPPHNTALFKLWLQRINNPQLFLVSPKSVYRNYRICDRHFEKKLLREAAYYGSNQAVLVAGAAPTLFLNEVIEPKNRQGTGPIRWDHTYSRKEVNTESIPPDAVEICVPAERDNDPCVVAATSSASGPFQTPPRERGLPRRIKVRRVAKSLYNHTKVMQRKYVCRSKTVKRLSDCFKEAARQDSLETVERLVGPLQPATRRFLLQQLREQPRNKPGRRFSLDEKIIAVSLLKRMRGSYKLMKPYFTMPSVASLRRVLAQTPLRPGVNVDLEQHLLTVQADLELKETYCILLFDVVAIQPHLSFDAGEDVIRGFQNCGTRQKSVFADRALVFMLRGFYRRWQQPYAFMFLDSSTKTTDLVGYIKEVLRSALSTNLKVLATICEPSATNRAAINVLKQETRIFCDRAGLGYREESFLLDGREIVHLYDPAHLLKGIRNHLLTNDLDFQLDNTQYRASWQDILTLYTYDRTGTVVRCPSLNDSNVLPHKIRKMSVKNSSAEVFSRTVYAGLQNLLDERTPDEQTLRQSASGTAKLINFMDQLFDSVSGARNPDEHVRELRRPLSPSSRHIEFWTQARQILGTMKFVKRSGRGPAAGRVPALANWTVTLNGFVYLWQSLKYVGFKSLDLGAFNQDPLENFIGSIRSHSGANRNPTCASFVSSFRTLCIDDLAAVQSAGTNCDQDDDVPLTNLKSFLSEDASGLSTSCVTSDETVVLDQTYQRHGDAARTTSGYVARKLMQLKGVSTCATCLSQLLTADTLPDNSLIADRLTRPNTNFTKRCTAVIDATLRLLPLHGHKDGIMKLIKRYINNNHVVPSFACEIHDVTNAFVDFTIKFTIYCWTRNVNKLLVGNDTRIRPNMDRVERLAVERYRKSLKRWR